MDEQSRPEPPLAGNEVDTLLGSLERQRATFAWKTGGLDAAGLQARLGPSAVTLGGLIKHMARVEDSIFAVRLFGRDPYPPWDTHDWDWDWQSAAEDTPEQLYALWQDSVARSRTLAAEALAEGGLDRPAAGIAKMYGVHATMRRLLIDFIEEYARHVGHADLIRESVDGLVGEDPPG
jgi:hypothetical protein